MNEPPPVLHSGTTYSVPLGWPLPGLLMNHMGALVGSSKGWRKPELPHSDGLTGSTRGMNVPPVSRPMTAVASADTSIVLMPMTLPNVVPTSRTPPARTPWARGGGGMSSAREPTSTHSTGEVATTPVDVTYAPVTST